MYDLLKDVHVARRTFAKTEKYALGEKLENALLDVLLSILEAGRERHEWKVAAIEAALRNLEKARILIRLAWDTQQIHERRMSEWQAAGDKIGRMLGGWRKAS
ncbi:MAG: Uncharacterized protein G01um101438_864 [Parcubacteria group bacterium Gr01-1014_38]|nr:MAG: Uncharacterized protein G01um101438_864 [Parcubacteria group bacterium Gr01-1014_38]